MTPVALCLRVNGGVAINFARRCLQDRNVQALGETKHIYSAVHARFGRLDWIVLVVDRRGGASEIVDLVDFHIERKCDVMTHELKRGIAE